MSRSTPEGVVKDKIKKVLAANQIYWHCPVQNGMGEPSLDFICCFKGLYFAIEAKAPGKKITTRQEYTMSRIHACDGVTFTIDGDTTKLEEWIRHVSASR